MGRGSILLAAACLTACLSACFPVVEARERACAETARLDLPVRLADFGDRGMLWPHGVHGAAHPEGHPGIDFNLSAEQAEIPVFAPIEGEIVALAPEEDNPGSSCLLLDSACIQVNLCHLRPEPGLGEGSRVRRGQLLGKVVPVSGGGAYSLHLGAYLGSGDRPVCPADFLHPDTVRCRLGETLGANAPSGCGSVSGSDTWMTRSLYPESAARELTLTCADGTRQVFALPGETSLCNARLPESTRKALETCLGPGCAGVW